MYYNNSHQRVSFGRYSNLDSVLTTGYLSYGNDCVNVNLYIQLARLSSLAHE
jgi:hypothetical protein